MHSPEAEAKIAHTMYIFSARRRLRTPAVYVEPSEVKIPAIHQFTRIARLGYGVYGYSLILLSRMVITGGGFEAFLG